MINIAKKLLIMLIVSVFVISVVSATAYAVDVAFEKNVVEFKEKKVTSFKIKWDANGGKIGTKKTVTSTVKKGAKVKLVTTPKRAGYTFQGWYTKKTSGTKITKNTKTTKSLTYYAQWKKVLNNDEKKLLGKWFLGSVSGSAQNSLTGAFEHTIGMGYIETFNEDGTYDIVLISNTAYSKYAAFTKGFWRMSGDTVYMTNLQYQDSKDGGKTWSSWIPTSTPNKSMKIQFGNDENGQYYEDLKYSGAKVRKMKI